MPRKKDYLSVALSQENDEVGRITKADPMMTRQKWDRSRFFGTFFVG